MNLVRLAEGRTAEVFAWETGKIVKVYRPGFPPGDARFEAETAVKVQASGVACPHFFEQVEVEGRPALVYERIEGRPMVELVFRQPWRIPEYARRMARLHLEMHTPEISADLPTQRGKYTRRIEHCDLLPAPLKQALLDRLARLPDDRRLCHGDFHPGNIMIARERFLTIDWMDVSVGQPLADVARTSIILAGAEATDKNPLVKWVAGWFHRLYLQEYLQAGGDADVYRACLPIVAAARLMENIPEQQDWLLRQAGKTN